MKTLVSIPEELEQKTESHRVKHYPDLTIPKMFMRLLFEDIKRKGEEK